MVKHIYMHEASFYTKLDQQKVQCNLCPRNCIIDIGKFGDCYARRNRDGILSSEVYGRLAAIGIDPIEKKPLYHFYPSKKILSIGTTGCNMHCVFCQNHELSQCKLRKPANIYNLSPEQVIDQANKSSNNIGLAYTYNEPTVNFEFMIESARLAKLEDMKTVIISNGYINADPLHMLLEYTDAFNIDLKAFIDTFYKKYTKSTLKPVLDTIKSIANSNKHLEITHLVIPQANSDEDEFENMCKWIANETGEDTPLHISRYFPRYEMDQYPTPPETLFAFYDIAKLYLHHVYIGNIATELHSNTYCPHCNSTLIERTLYHTVKKNIDNSGKCSICGTAVISNI